MPGRKFICGCFSERKNRFLEPSLLLLLSQKSAHGYEMISDVEQLGFHEAQPDPGALYRKLRHMEELKLVTSQWDTSGFGPAKRLYHITRLGRQYLDNWAEVLKTRNQALENFLKRYNQFKQ